MKDYLLYIFVIVCLLALYYMYRELCTTKDMFLQVSKTLVRDALKVPEKAAVEAVTTEKSEDKENKEE